jgi:predicted amidohydrolase YtcJ
MEIFNKDIVLYNGKITTLDPKKPEVSAVLIQKGIIADIKDEK